MALAGHITMVLGELAPLPPAQKATTSQANTGKLPWTRWAGGEQS